MLSEDVNHQMLCSHRLILIMEKIRKSCAVEIKSSTLMSCLSLGTMTLLIFASVVIITIIAVTPIIILGIGELPEGQRDIIVKPRLDYLNITQLSEVGQVTAMPRIMAVMATNFGQQVTCWFMNFKLQREQHLGTIGGDQPQGHNYIYANQQIGLKAGQTVNLTYFHKHALYAMRHAIQQNKLHTSEKSAVLLQINDLLRFQVPLSGTFEVRETFDTASGKFGIGNVNNFIYIDITTAFHQIVRSTLGSTGKNPQDSALVRLMDSPYFDLGQFASEATVNIENRIDIYSNPNYEQTFATVSEYGKKLLDKIGIFSVETSMPIAANLVPLGFIGMFIGVMFKLIIFSLFLLSVIMMNNMFRVGIERKGFDFALLKVMGADRFFIVANILTGTLKYIILANLIAYPLAFLALQTITSVFEDFFGYRHQITPTSDSIYGGLFIGVLVPIISAIAPIWGVIKDDLAENLNPLRNKTEATKVEVYVEGREFPVGKVVFGVLAASFGLMIYYLLPRSLINQNLGLLLVIFFVILEGLLVGLILLSFSVQYILERIVAYLCLFWVESTDLLLTLKNLSSHRFRNRRTSLLYALSVSFIVFVSVGLQIQLQTIYIQMLKAKGSYIVIYGGEKEYYNNLLGQVEGVEDWAFESQSLTYFLKQKTDVKEILISDKARLFFDRNNIRAVSPNLINTFFYEKVSYYKSEATPPYDPYSYLYSQEGLMTCTIGKYVAKKLGILEGEDHEFLINIYHRDGFKRIPLRYTSVFEKRMGLFYSNLPFHTDIGVSFDTYRALGNIPRDQDIPIRYTKVKISNISDVKAIAGRIRALNQNSNHVWDYTELKETIDRIDDILTIVTQVLLGIVLAISFFSLLTTTYLNIVNQTNEIAILLILGYPKTRIIRIYVYESLVLVLNSCLIGLVVGYLVAQMMGLQREIFSQLPIQVQIRGVPLLFAVALLSSFLSTYQPLREIFSLTVSQILNYAK